MKGVLPMGFFKRRKLRKLAEQERKQALVQKAPEPVVEEKKVEPVVQQKKIEPEKPAPKKVQVKKPTESSEDEKMDAKAAKYHVSQNKDPKSDSYRKWRVRKEGSNKTIKFFDTQKQAIEYAESLANTAGSSVVIHKMDGSIRKQDYAKKA